MFALIITAPILFLFRELISFLDLSALSSQIHEKCLDQISFTSSWIDIYKALICGHKLPNGEIKRAFIQGGCIHLMVVSGAHLLFLEKIWNKIPIPYFKRSALILILIVYAMASKLHPPILRALFSFLIVSISKSQRLFWNSHFITHLSGILCLIYEPKWMHSASLQLSWLASFLQNIKTSGLMKASLIYACISPIVNRWQQLHPLTVFINWLVAPFIATFLFPITFLSFLFSPLHYISDFLWAKTFLLIQSFNSITSVLPVPNWQLSPKIYWLYIISIFILVSFLDMKQKRSCKKKALIKSKPLISFFEMVYEKIKFKLGLYKTNLFDH